MPFLKASGKYFVVQANAVIKKSQAKSELKKIQ
jgi:hypothetical protein